MKYLDPKNDLTFKRIFGEHPDLLMSFLNAVLPLDSPVENIIYKMPEWVSRLPFFKNSIVDVKCKDQNGRQFIVEMQMLWTDAFKSRVVFNASKAYIKQIDKSEEYKGLEPIFSLNIVNENFEHDMADYFHHYKHIHTEHNNKLLEGLEFVLIELPKFRARNYTDKKLNILWLRFLSEIKDNQEVISEDFMTDQTLKKALELLEESAYTTEQLETYDRHWDAVSSEKTLITDAYDEGKLEGKPEVVKSLK